MSANAGPLVGLKVLDFSTTPAGAHASQLLADFGAEVVQVEQPGGSLLRKLPSYPFMARGKKSIELDLKNSSDQAVARELAAGCDILIETFRPGVIERFGLGYGELSKLNSGLIHTSITGFGHIGPYANVKGYEALVLAKVGGQAMSGGMVTREGPAHVSVPFATYAASQTALQGIFAALHERERSGLGQRVDASLIQALSGLGPWNWYLRVVTDKFPDAFIPQEPFSENNVPTSGMFFMLLIALTSDGHWLQFSQVQPKLFKAMIKAMGLSWIFEDSKFKTAPMFETEELRVEFWELLINVTKQKSLAQWQAIMEDDHDVWAETFRRGSGLLDHPQIKHLGVVIEVNDTEKGKVRQIGALAKLAKTPAVINVGAPTLNQHGSELRSSPWAVRAAHGAKVAGKQLALDGVTVLELGTFYAGPFGSNMLADLGARVIKVEPLEGDPMRNILPFPEVGAAKVMQGKDCIAVDVGSDEGRAIVYELARRSDIVLQSFRAGVAKRQGVDEVSLREINPNIIYLNAPGYGIDGPCGDRPAYAPTIGAGSGIAMRNVGSLVPERPDLSIAEIRAGGVALTSATAEYAQADGIAALSVGTAMLLGLVVRNRTGIAQEMLTTMLTSAAHLLSDDMVEYANRPPTQQADTELYGFGARYRMYKCSDGWIFLAAPQENEWSSLVSSMAGHVQLADDPRFVDEVARVANDTALAEILSKTFVTNTCGYWQALLLSGDVGVMTIDNGPPEKCYMVDDLADQSQFAVQVEHPIFGHHLRMAPLVRLSRSGGVANPSKLLGADTTKVLHEINYSDDQIDDLRKNNRVI